MVHPPRGDGHEARSFPRCYLLDKQNTQLLKNGGFCPFSLIPQGLNHFWLTVDLTLERHHLCQAGKRASVCSVIQTEIWGYLVVVRSYCTLCRNLHCCGVRGGPSWNINGKTSALPVANIGPGYGSLVGSPGVLGLLDTEKIIFLATRSNSSVTFSFLLYWAGSGWCIQQRGLVVEEVILRIPWLTTLQCNVLIDSRRQCSVV